MYLTENWRLKDQRYSLQGIRNPETEEVTFPPRVVAIREIETYTFNQDDEEQPQMVDAAVELAEAV